MNSLHNKENIVETDALCNRGNVNATLSFPKECSANKQSDNKDIFNNDILEDHNNELGPGEKGNRQTNIHTDIDERFKELIHNQKYIKCIG